MKKILTAMLCIALATVALTSCSSKRYNPDEEKSKAPVDTEVTVTDEDEFEVPEEQKDFEVDVEMGLDYDALKIKAYNGEAEELVIPATLIHPELGELPVVKVGEAAFLGNETLKKVEISEGVTIIGAGAFQSCSALTDVVLPEGLETIGDSAFESSALTNINIPATVTSIGKHAFSTYLNPTPWYKAQTAQKVIVGDGILLKYNGTGDVTFGNEVKRVAYYAFQSPGAINVKFDYDLESFDALAVYEIEGNYEINFLVPYKSNAAKLLDTTPYAYVIHGITPVEGNPFKWTFDTAADLDSWYGGNLDTDFAPEGAIHGKATGVDYQFCCNDKIYLPAEHFKTMAIRMKHETGAAIDESRVAKNIQIYFNNGSGLSEAASVKLDVLPTSNGEYVDYTLDMSSCDAWKDIITYFRIDTLQGLEGDFWLDSVEFLPEDPAFDFSTLLKPITKYVPSDSENPYKYKFEDESKALAWTMAGFEYSYAPIADEGDNDSIHGILDPAVESLIVSPVVNVPGTAYRQLIVRLRSALDEMTDENKDNYKIKVYFDNGEGFSEERSLEMNVEQNSNGEKVEYKLDMYTLDGWYGNVKQIKIVLPENMGGEFWIDKVEFVPETKLTRAEFIDILFKSDDESQPSGESIFFDVVEYDSYCNAVIWATEKGFVERVSDNKFNPDKLLTAGEFADIMNKYAALKGSEKTFEAADANATVYKMDALNDISSVFEAPEEETEAAE